MLLGGFVLALALCTAWGVLVLLYSPLAEGPFGALPGWLWLGVGLLALAAWPRRTLRRQATLALITGFALILVGWATLQPSNQRDWQADVAELPWATVDGDSVTVHNIRDATYRTETDYDVRWLTRSYDLRRLDTVDLIAVYWAGPAIAHVMLSFGFADGQPLAISIEARKQRGEGYSAIKGFFRNYELVYVAAEERDVIGLRSNIRRDPPEDVYIYRLPAQPDRVRAIFLDYVRAMNDLRRQPAWYNSASSNCTNTIWLHAAVNPGHVPFSWKILLSGYVPEYLFDQGRLMPGLPFAELRRRGHVNARAQEGAGLARDAADFSRSIRVGVPGYGNDGARQEGTAR